MANLLEPSATPTGYAVQYSTNAFMQRVYAWMAFALFVSSVTAYTVANSTIVSYIVNNGIFTLLLITEIVVVMVLSWAIDRINALTAQILLVLYSVLNGLTLSVIFLVYEMGSIISIFAATAIIFALMAIYGYVTKRDLTGIGTMALFGLIGIVIAGVINLFIHNEMTNLVISAIGVIVFVALTAYDSQKIKAMGEGLAEGESFSKRAVLGALTLYLDFVNLFLNLLRIFGNRR